MLIAIDISIGDVHAADIADLAINHHNLAVVAPVDAEGDIGQGDLKEGVHLNTRPSHALEHPRLEVERADIVIEHPYLHTLLRLVHEQVDHPLPHLIVLDDKVLQVDVVAGLLDIGQERLILLLTCCKDIDIVTDKQVGSHQLVH